MRTALRTLIPIAGAVLLFAGAALLIVQGTVLQLLAGSELAALDAIDAAGLAMFAAGLLLGATAFIRESGANAAGYLNLGAYTLLVLGSLTLAYLIAANHPARWDMTARRYHSLSPQTIQYLKGLNARIELVAFHTPDTAISKLRLLDILNRYAAASPRVSIEVYNPVTQPLKAAEYGEKVRGGDVFVRRLDGATTAARELRRIASIDEETITNAIVQVVRGRDTTVYFLEGHGERPMDADGPDPQQTFTGMRDFFANRGFKTQSLNLLAGGGEALPADGSILVCIGPMVDLSAVEREALEEYFDRGGKALFMLDPVPNERIDLIEFRRLLGRFGIEIRNDIVVDADLIRREEAKYAVFIDMFGRHAIVENMPRINLPMWLARTARRAPLGSPDATVSELLFSSADSFDLDFRELLVTKRASLQGRKPARLPLAVAAEKLARHPAADGPDTARLVVFGDSDLFSDLYWNQGPAALMASSVNWLGADETSIPAPALRVEMPPLFLTGAQRRTLEVVLVLLMPFSILFGGVAYCLARRRLG